MQIESGDELPDVLFRHLVEQSSDVLILVNSAGLLRYVSPAVFSVFGHGLETSSFSEFLQWIHPDDRSALLGLLEAPVTDLKALQSRLRHQKGHWVSCSLFVQDFVGNAIPNLGEADSNWYLISLRSLDLPQGREQLHSAELTRDTEPVKSRFLAIMSHELRTPINAINGFSQLLLQQRRAKLSTEQEDMVQRILTNGKHLLSLINTVLDLSKLEAGRMLLHLESINVSDLIEGTVQELSSLATQNNLTVKTEVSVSDQVIVNDPLRLRQILVNLLSNAIKFSEDGEVWVVVEDFEQSKLRISVQDSGPGIASGDIEQVFSEFWQADQFPSRQHQGTGLGLAICHNLAKMMQGEIQVHSQLGQGATFRLVIPRQISLTEPYRFKFAQAKRD